MSFLHLHSVSNEGHKALTTLPSRGMPSYRKVGHMQIKTHATTLAQNDDINQRAPLLAGKSPPSSATGLRSTLMFSSTTSQM
jgi:hypothetical protein